MRSFATMRPGTDWSAVRLLLHLQSFTGHPQPGHTLPTPVEYTILPSAIRISIPRIGVSISGHEYNHDYG
jgi:hypothetical protein